MARTVSGYMVVRRPKFGGEAIVEEGQPTPTLDFQDDCHDVQYHGVQRLDWYDFTGAYYDQTLSPEMREFWQELFKSRPLWCDFETTSSFEKVSAALEFLRKTDDKNEICAVYCYDDCPTEMPNFNALVRWLGLDVYVHGYGSVNLQGIFARPDLFANFVPKLNRYGLFNLGDDVLPCLMERCSSISPEDNIEIFPQRREIWQYVFVGVIDVR